MGNPDITQILKLAWPIILIQLVLQIYAIVDIAKKKKVKNLSIPIWVIIIIIGELLGPILYLVTGRSEEE